MICVAVGGLVSGCDSQADLEAKENLLRKAQADAALAAEAEEDARNLESVKLVEINQAIRDELGFLAGRNSSGEELLEHAEALIWRVERNMELLEKTTSGLGVLIDVRMRAASLLADARVDLSRKALAIVEENLELARVHMEEDPSSRTRVALHGNAQAGKARVLRALGRYIEAGELYNEAILVLEAADKGRGTGTGSGEFRGDAAGGGKGRGRGKGKNKTRSLSSKRHMAILSKEASEAFRLGGDLGLEFYHLSRERLFRSVVCQMEHGSPGIGFQIARMELAEVIDRLGDNSVRKGEHADAVEVKKLTLRILRELWEEIPEEPKFYEAILPQQVEIASCAADLGLEGLESLKSTVTQALEDLKVIHNLGLTAQEAGGWEARLCLQMARGLTLASESDEVDAAALRAAAANWYGRVIVILESLKEEGALPRSLVPVEEAGILGLSATQNEG